MLRLAGYYIKNCRKLSMNFSTKLLISSRKAGDRFERRSKEKGNRNIRKYL